MWLRLADVATATRSRAHSRKDAALERLVSPWTLLALLLVWAFLPLVVTAVYASRHGGHATGAWSSLLIEDVFQYWAWIRESGDHVAIANLFNTVPPDHVYVYPPFLLSGALWRLGLPLPVAYHLWTVVGAAALVFSVAAYARRSLPDGGWRAATVLAVVFGSPVWLAVWLITGSSGGDRLMAYVLAPLSALWGYIPRLLSVALMPVFMLALERVLQPGERGRGRALAAACALGAAVAWLHPWQGLVLLLVPIGLFAWDRFDRRGLILALPVAATALPLAYYGALHHFVPDWEHASENLNYYAATDFLIILVPFAAFAALGVRRPGSDVHERALLLWPVASAVSFLAPTGGRFEAIAGLSIPLSILIVRAWQRFALPRAVTAVAMAVMLLAGILPMLRDAPSDVRDGAGTTWLRNDDRDALRYIETAAGPGSVLADSHVAAPTVALTGRHAWAAHANWTPEYVPRATAVNAVLAGTVPARTAQSVAAAAGAGYVFLDCQRSAATAAGLRPLVRAERRFGCARVLELRAP